MVAGRPAAQHMMQVEKGPTQHRRRPRCHPSFVELHSMHVGPPERPWGAEHISATKGGHLQSPHRQLQWDPLGGGKANSAKLRLSMAFTCLHFFRVPSCTDARQAAMPLNTSHYLTKQGWKGHGTPLDGEKGRGLKKPLIIPQKRNLGGVGQNRDRAVEWWDDIFAVGTCQAYSTGRCKGFSARCVCQEGHRCPGWTEARALYGGQARARAAHAHEQLCSRGGRGNIIDLHGRDRPEHISDPGPSSGSPSSQYP